MTGELAFHPIVAALAAAIVQHPDGRLELPQPAVDKARASLRANDERDVIVHLVALGQRTHRIAGAAGRPILEALAVLLAEKLGSAAEVADRFAAAGVDKETAALLGKAVEQRAPIAQPQTTGPAVKARRGLSRSSDEGDKGDKGDKGGT